MIVPLYFQSFMNTHVPGGVCARNCRRQESGCPGPPPARKAMESEAKSLALESRGSVGHRGEGHRRGCEGAALRSPSPAVSGLGGSECIKRRMHKYAV